MVTQAKPLRQEMNTKYGFHWKRWVSTSGATCLDSKWLNQTYQLRPWDHQIHLVRNFPLASAFYD
jgi:hypothetical protein